ncbi:hypothetical protein PQX77_012904 [Marasmius sp. AFHP31]|nr:hypothetical protein PQX77_012904 [Marasmius sp. AFHP31]
MYCRLCCSACKCSSDNNPGSSDNTPTALRNLIPAGTLELHLHKFPLDLDTLCDHEHNEDGWHDFDSSKFSNFISEAELLKEVSFLNDHDYISITYSVLDDGTLVLRVYLIPYDLPGGKGRYSLNAREKYMRRAKSSMPNILACIRQDMATWNGVKGGLEAGYLMDTAVDRRTLSEIYSDLPSPKPNPTSSISLRLLDSNDNLAGLGLANPLYRYQRRTVASMIEHESGERRIPDPLYISLVDIHGKPFYYQPGTTEIKREISEVSVRGGVLCEELGTGKTIMTLALVMSNLNELSTPESSGGPPPTILTPLSVRVSEPRHDRKRKKQTTTTSEAFWTFRELLVDKLSRVPLSTVPDTSTSYRQGRQAKREQTLETIEQLPTPYLEWRAANAPFYLKEGEVLSDNRASARNVKSVSRALLLTSATIIVVPANLVSQWDREIQKHCSDVPRVLIVRRHQNLPHARKLAVDYDIVLMTDTSFNDGDKLAKEQHDPYKLCRCPELPNTRIPDCKCYEKSKISPLLQIRWKRLVVDEGHISGTMRNRLTPFSQRVSVQSRWIVTGTPTTNLLGLSFGKRAVVDDSSPNPDDIPMPAKEVLSPATDDDVTVVGELMYPPEPRIWTRDDADDIKKLFTMLAHFVGVKLLATPQGGKDTTKDTIKDPLLNKRGPQPGAIKILIQLMSFTMIRHRAEDVEGDVVLPKLEHESVFLNLEPYAAKSYNALQAAVAINAIDSERTDKDYLFHEANKSELQTLVKNMSQILFWSVDQGVYNVEELHKNGHLTLARAERRQVGPEDMKLAKEALAHTKIAYEDKLWQEMQQHEDIPHFVHGMNPAVFKSWSRLPESDQNGQQLIHPDRLVQLRDWAIKHPFKPVRVLVELGQHNAEIDVRRRMIFEAEQEKKQRKSKGAGRVAAVRNNNEQKVADAAKEVSTGGLLKEMQNELQASLERLAMVEGEEDDAASVAARNTHVNATSNASSLANPAVLTTRVGKSCSSKLNYIIQDVLRHSKDEKFLIFSDSELTLAHVAEGLHLAQVKFLRFTTQVPPNVREQMVLTFETSDLYRVFLMELKHGARGLNLVTASRVIFCEPVWQADVESQAIKRAHRIGQTRPVHVKTLAIRNTAEEKIVEWRHSHKDETDLKAAKIPLEQVEIRDFIKNPRFLYPRPSQNSASLDFPLLPSRRAPEKPPSPVVSQPNVRFDVPPQSSPEKRKITFPVVNVAPPPKKRKVAFAN